MTKDWRGTPAGRTLAGLTREFLEREPFPTYSAFEDSADLAVRAWVDLRIALGSDSAGIALTDAFDRLSSHTIHLWNFLATLELDHEDRLPLNAGIVAYLRQLFTHEADVAANAARALIHLVDGGASVVETWLMEEENRALPTWRHIDWVHRQFRAVAGGP